MAQRISWGTAGTAGKTFRLSACSQSALGVHGVQESKPPVFRAFPAAVNFCAFVPFCGCSLDAVPQLTTSVGTSSGSVRDAFSRLLIAGPFPLRAFSMIGVDSVEKACSEVGEYSDEQMVEEFDRFFRAQPAICDFVVELTHESGMKVQELSLFLAYMIFKTMETDTPDSVVKVTSELIEAGYRDTESWMERLSAAEGTELQASIASNLQTDAEPYLLQYVISELNEPMEDGSELNDEEKGEVFFVVKTVIESFKNQSKGIIIEPE
jgi:hypothetical protein